MFSLAMDEELIERNPFRGLMRKPTGRADQAPPTDAEFEKLLEACAVLGDHGARMRALVTFAAFSGMRPGELMALDWSDVNLPALRVTVSKRLYRGTHRPSEVEQGARDRAHAARQGRAAERCPSGRVRCSCRRREGGCVRRCCPPTGARCRRRRACGSTCTSPRSTVRPLHEGEAGLPNHVIAAQMGWTSRRSRRWSRPTHTPRSARSKRSTRQCPNV